jgi:5-methylcytosine-specific restriction endonuclease McrA
MKAPDDEWLEHHYVTLEKPASIIAHEVGADTTTIIRWLKASRVHYRTYLEAKRLQGEGIRQGTSEGAARALARKLLLRAGVPKRCARCARCGMKKGWIEVHHLDEDCTNNALENLQWLCRSCHVRAHSKLRRQQGWPPPPPAPRGEANPSSKLIEEEVLEIRDLYATGECTQQELADEFDVTQAAISLIVRRKKWDWLI